MKNSDMPAMPMGRTNSGGYWLKRDLDDGYAEQCKPAFGLTKREMFAMAAMNGIMSNSNDRYTYEQLAGHAVAQADALLSELEKQK